MGHISFLCNWDLLSENVISLHNSVFETFAIEMHGAKYTYYNNNFTHFFYKQQNNNKIVITNT